MFSLATIPQENINPNCGFQGAEDVCLDPPNRSNSGWSVCMHVYICLCVCGVSVCLCRGEQGKEGGGRESAVLFSAVLSVPEACRLQFAVVTTSKLCRKIATVSGKPHFPAHHNYR